MAAPRNLQLDGWRAVAVLGVMWLHWTPREWRGAIPFEIGLYFFLALTGFLITRGLLRDRARGEAGDGPWRADALRRFQVRRALRILVPCYAAMAFAWLVGAPDIRQHPWPYLLQLSNFHIAWLPEYPSGTAHYWTLAIQQQFYLLWPLLIYFAPRRSLPVVLGALFLVAPLSRALLAAHAPQLPHPGALSPCALDYLAGGALLALARAHGRTLPRWLPWLGLAAYLPLYALDEAGHPLPRLRHFQQSFLTLAMLGLIAATLDGLPGVLGRWLESRPLQHLARLSYSLYLLHTCVPLALGWLAPVLWSEAVGPLLRLAAYLPVTWGLAWLSWRFLEQPLDRLRARA